MDTTFSLDLEDAARRSETFPKGWPVAKIREAIDRYAKFLRLAAKFPDEPIAPASDIDEIWHLHMLRPSAYVADCQQIVGHLLDHDGGFGKDVEEAPRLAANFERTSMLWMREYGESYTANGSGSVKCTRNCVSRCQRACKTK